MKSLKNLLAVAAGFFLLVACNAERESIPAEELYYRNFIKKYGLIDTDHNWSLATNQNITVKGARGKDVKIYADFSGKRHLVADYSAIADNATLTFDVPAEVKTVIARVGSTSYTVNIGETLNASGSRTIENHEQDDLFWSETTTDKRVFRTSPIEQVLQLYPEDPGPDVRIGGNITNDGTNSFYFISDGNPHTFYPFFWNTNNYHILGIYIPDESATETDGVRFYPLYHSKSGELERTSYYEPEVYFDGNYKVGDTRDIHGNMDNSNDAQVTTEVYKGKENKIQITSWYDELGKTWEDAIDLSYEESEAVYFTDHGYISHISRNAGSIDIYFTEVVQTSYQGDPFTIPEKSNWIGCGTNDPSWVTKPDQWNFASHIRTKGITYKVKEGTPYGFYLKILGQQQNESSTDTDDKPIVFSQASRTASWGENIGKNSNVRSQPWSNKSWWNQWNEANPKKQLTETDKYVYASWTSVTVDEKPYHIFAFEDWIGCEAGGDLNDLMFLFDDAQAPTNVVDEKKDDPVGDPVTWTIAVDGPRRDRRL